MRYISVGTAKVRNDQDVSYPSVTCLCWCSLSLARRGRGSSRRGSQSCSGAGLQATAPWGKRVSVAQGLSATPLWHLWGQTGTLTYNSTTLQSCPLFLLDSTASTRPRALRSALVTCCCRCHWSGVPWTVSCIFPREYNSTAHIITARLPSPRHDPRRSSTTSSKGSCKDGRGCPLCASSSRLGALLVCVFV